MLEVNLEFHNLLENIKDTPKPGQLVIVWDKFGSPNLMRFGFDGFGWYDPDCRYYKTDVIVAWAEVEEIVVPSLTRKQIQELSEIRYESR